jgi:DNA-binding NarL/FixJ family response regulator
VIAGRAEERPGLAQLTDRQRQVLHAMAEGCSNLAIARQLGISEKAVVQHVSHIYDQLGLAVTEDSHRRVRAVLRYLEDDR